MAKHHHLILDFDSGEITGIGLPKDVSTTGSGSSELTAVLSGVSDGSNRIFLLPVPVIHVPPGGIQIKIHHGGRRIPSDQFVVYESVPTVSGLDTVRLKYFAPGSRNQIIADFTPA